MTEMTVYIVVLGSRHGEGILVNPAFRTILEAETYLKSLPERADDKYKHDQENSHIVMGLVR